MSIYRVLADCIQITHSPAYQMQRTYEMEFNTSNRGQCAAIMEHLKQAVVSACSVKTEHTFLPSERTWFALNHDCAKEHRQLQEYMNAREIAYTYQIIYKLHEPYTIEYNHSAKSLNIRQPV